MKKFWCVSLVLLLTALCAGARSLTPQVVPEILEPRGALLASADPIFINGNGGFTGYPGNGTKADPYRIVNLTINGNATAWCIAVQSTDCYFIINGCTLSNATAGVLLINVTFATVNGSVITNTATGIDFKSVENSTIVNSTIRHTINGGILTFLCHNNTITANTVEDNPRHGIQVEGSDENEISGNTLRRNGIALVLWTSHNNTVSRNTFQCNDEAWQLQSSTGNTFHDNVLLECETPPIPGFGWVACLIAGAALVAGGFLRARAKKAEFAAPRR